MTILILAAALAAQMLPAPGAVAWEAVSQDDGGRYSIDPAGIVRDGERVRFLMRGIAAQIEADGISAAVVRVMIDCRARTSAMLAGDFYRGEAFVRSMAMDEDEIELRPIAENSGWPRLLRRVCGG